MWKPNLVITVPVDVLKPGGAGQSADTCLTTIFYMLPLYLDLLLMTLNTFR